MQCVSVLILDRSQVVLFASNMLVLWPALGSIAYTYLYTVQSKKTQADPLMSSDTA